MPAKYTLWNIPRSEWSRSPIQDIEITEEVKKDLISFAEKLDDSRLVERLCPFNTPVTQETLLQPVCEK